jgi:hypothetical protein
MEAEPLLGEHVFVARYGLGKVVGQLEAPLRYVVELREGTVDVPVADAAVLVRRPIAREAALKLVARICDRAAPRGELAELRSVRAFGRLPPEGQAEYLRLAYRAPRALSPGDLTIVLAQKELLLDELAFILDVESEHLRASLKRGDPSLRSAPKAGPRAKLVELDGFESLGTFSVTGSLSIADPCYLQGPTERAGDVWKRYVGRARSGVWHGFVKVGDDGNEELFAVHEAFAKKALALRTKVDGLATLWVDAAKVAIVDPAAFGDPLFVAEHLDRIEEDGVVWDRGVACSSGDDGSFGLSGAAVDGELVLVVVSFV